MEVKKMIRNLLVALLVILYIPLSAQNKNKIQDYFILAGKEVRDDPEWNSVVKTLQEKHQASVFYYTKMPREALKELQKSQPRYVAIVEKPENIGKEYIIDLHKLCREVDEDIYADFLWGVITGYNADGAMKMVKNSTEPLVIKSAVSTIMELKSGKWFDRFAYVDDHTPGKCGEKKAGEISVKQGYTENILRDFCDFYAAYDPDLLVTAAHATENNLEMPFSLGNIKAKDGVLYADFPEKPENLQESGKRKVYFAVGNCLIGNVNQTKESMAIAWMNSGNAATMIGYIVPTWYGRSGWGSLKYWLTVPGRTTLAEAVYLNQQDMLAQEQMWYRDLLKKDYPFEDGMNRAAELIEKSTGRKATMDQLGFFHDRNVLAYYGDPKWEVRLQKIPEEDDFTVEMKEKGDKCIVSITTKANFSAARMTGDQFKQEHVLDLPFSYFFPQRLNHPRLAAGQSWKAVVDENFLLIYDAGFEPGKTYTVVLNTNK
ncbi:MAG: hypothetical protein RSA98_01745 [Odoribacter sp.]